MEKQKQDENDLNELYKKVTGWDITERCKNAYLVKYGGISDEKIKEKAEVDPGLATVLLVMRESEGIDKYLQISCGLTRKLCVANKFDPCYTYFKNNKERWDATGTRICSFDERTSGHCQMRKLSKLEYEKLILEKKS